MQYLVEGNQLGHDYVHNHIFENSDSYLLVPVINNDIIEVDLDKSEFSSS